MPKTGLSEKEWWARLRKYADGEFVFRKGQKPPKTSKWTALILKIDSCPCQSRLFGVNRTIFGGTPVCSCGFHKKKAASTATVPQPLHTVSPTLTTKSVAQTAPTASVSSSNPQATSSIAGIPSVVLPTTGIPVTSMVVSDISSQALPSCPQPVRMIIHYADRLPKGWSTNMSECDCEWVGKTLFVDKGILCQNLKSWWIPPDPAPSPGHPNSGSYFHRKLFLWMPRKMWAVEFMCPKCNSKLWARGLYRNVRIVFALDGMFYLAGEHMECSQCRGTYISWDNRMLSQLTVEVRALFPITLTHKYAIDVSVLSLLRSRTLGNSSTQLQHSLEEIHARNWMQRELLYLADCERNKKFRVAQGLQPVTYKQAPPLHAVPCARWFQACYLRDVYHRLPTIKAELTSVFGNILKVDSTKKITKKLQGEAAGTASWLTSIGNEINQVLISVMTTSESTLFLQPMADGLMTRYTNADQDPPILIYTDRDCCSGSGPSKYQALFHKWEGLTVKLDIWHFMRRLAGGCSTESHPLYPTFMSQLSRCIFVWDPTDVDNLRSAKDGELQQQGILNPTDAAIDKGMTKKEMARHCRRRTRSKLEMKELLEKLITSLATATDTLGVYLLKDEMNSIWTEQKHHLKCIEDPPGVELYRITNYIQKGGVRLPVYKCARGSTSLENFHLHVNRFIPGTVSNAVNFQGFLLDGLAKWNVLRGEAAQSPESPLGVKVRDVELQSRANNLSQYVHGKPLFPSFCAPRCYTGELIGLEYLLRQSDMQLPLSEDDVDNEIDEGYVDLPESVDQEEISDVEETIFFPDQESDNVLDMKGLPGWNKVMHLAEVLIKLGNSATKMQIEKIVTLWSNLEEYDKQALVYRASAPKPVTGRFARSKSTGYPGMERMKRGFLTAGVPSRSPSESRLVEAMCTLLMLKFPSPQKERGPMGQRSSSSRFQQVVYRYNEIRTCVENCLALTEQTSFVLFHINLTTVSMWFKNKTRKQEATMLTKGRQLPEPRMCSSEEHLSARELSQSTAVPDTHTNIVTFPQSSSVGRAGVLTSSKSIRNLQFEAELSSAVILTDPELPTQDCDLPPESEISSQTESLHVDRPTDLYIPERLILPLVPDLTPQPEPILPKVRVSSHSMLSTAPVSRTTMWRRKKAQKSVGQADDNPLPLLKRSYNCRVCQKPMNSEGHSQYRGNRYCPFAPNQISLDEWLAKRREELQKKKSLKD